MSERIWDILDDVCWPFTKNKKGIQTFKETGDERYIYQFELDKSCFQRSMAYEDFKNLFKRTTDDKVLQYKAFNIAKNPSYDGYKKGQASKFFWSKDCEWCM